MSLSKLGTGTQALPDLRLSPDGAKNDLPPWGSRGPGRRLRAAPCHSLPEPPAGLALHGLCGSQLRVAAEGPGQWLQTGLLS